jgi:BolA protein
MGGLWSSFVKKQENEALDRRFSPRLHAAMGMTDTIRTKLTAAFAPDQLEVIDDSASHEGHLGHDHGGETHFVVKIVAAEFAGLSRVERQRRIYAVLSHELLTQVHALQLETKAPGE